MKPISVVITSLRPKELELTIDSTEMHKDLVEVVVVSPWPPKPRDFVRHIPVPLSLEGDPIERDRRGELSFSKKVNLAVSHAQGEYIVWNNDDLHFVPGWAPALLEHMRNNDHKARPYLACLRCVLHGVSTLPYTIFGLLYANHGCIRKSDLSYVGGYLFDERMRTELVDPELSVRIWASGGMVEICPYSMIDVSTYTKANPNIPDELCTPYKIAWVVPDGKAFFDLWFWKYFWLFFRNYRRISKNFSNADGVLSKKLQNRGAFLIFLKPLLKLFFFTLIRSQKNVDITKRWLVRLVNRRWFTLDYKLPYNAVSVVRRDKTKRR